MSTPAPPALRLISIYQDDESVAISDIEGTDARAMLASVYYLFTEANLDEAMAELAGTSDYAGAQVLRFRSSWCFFVPATDSRTIWEVVRDAGAAGV